MPTPGSWSESNKGFGIFEVTLASWEEFSSYVQQELLGYTNYVYRGQRSVEWKLESGLDRLIRASHRTDVQGHLARFKAAAMGRRGTNPPPITNDDGWWALGQHHGFATPLLDWTSSPYVAAYFAFVEPDAESQTAFRLVYALAENEITERSSVILLRHQGSDLAPIIEFQRPESNENSRLLSQRGLFTRSPAGDDIEAWITRNLPRRYRTMVLIKLFIPNEGRVAFLKALNQMNINHLSLFPDLEGSSRYSNLAYTIGDY